MTALSAIIPTRDRPALLADCLRSLGAQERPDLEVVVVDDGSEPDLRAVVEHAAEALDVRYVRQDAAGLNVARNTGAEVARGEILAYLDDDTLVSPGWAEAVVEAFEARGCDGLAGRIELRLEGVEPRWLTPGLRAYLAELNLGTRPRWLGAGETPYGANCAVSRAVFARIGGFRPGLDRAGRSLVSNGDVEFFRRLRALGGRLAYEPRAHVLHRVPADRLTAAFFLRRAFAQGVSDVMLEEGTGGKGNGAGARWREVVRAGRAMPILVKGLARGHGAVSAAAWLAYCRGRAVTPRSGGAARVT